MKNPICPQLLTILTDRHNKQIKLVVVHWSRRSETGQLFPVQRLELLLLVPRVRIFSQTLDLIHVKLRRRQELEHTLRIIGRDVVQLGEIFLLFQVSATNYFALTDSKHT